MKISVRVKCCSREYKVEKIDDKNYIVAVKEPPAEGKANRAVIETLAQYFKVSKTRINIIRGLTSRRKIIEISQL